MRQFINPPIESWASLARRPQLDNANLDQVVNVILSRVKAQGDLALHEMTVEFEGTKLLSLKVSNEEIAAAPALLSTSLKEAILVAAANIRAFHIPQVQPSAIIETTKGVTCWKKIIPIQRVGIYVPGGTAPLFSTVLMLGIPAQLAGCPEVIMCSPASKDGSIHPAILFAASVAGIRTIYKIGGAQAIAAMAFGTETIPRVHKIFGPGNQYVTKAKQLLNAQGIAIDLPAGPSEVLVLSDITSNACFVAADLLAQAEHGPDSHVVLISLDEAKLKEVLAEIDQQLAVLPRKAIAEQSLKNSLAIFFSDSELAMHFINEYAPEHLIINTKDYATLGEKILHAGSVFLGPLTPESAGDYASGTNHTLPTNGFAKSYSGVSVDSFTRTMTFQELTEEGIKILGPVVEQLAEAENLEGHKRSITVRLNSLR